MSAFISRNMHQEVFKKLPIVRITPFTMQDYPEHMACILWFSGCNMACSYCHNPDLVKGRLKKMPLQDLLSFLYARENFLDGVVLSGGECTLSPELPAFTKFLKSLGYKVKIDTNGTNPDLLEKLIADKLIDFVALDFKAPSEKIYTLTGYSDFLCFKRALKILCCAKKSGFIDLEVRTTIHTDLLNEQDISIILSELEDSYFLGKFALQKVRVLETLGSMQEETRIFDFKNLKKTSFSIELRNF